MRVPSAVWWLTLVAVAAAAVIAANVALLDVAERQDDPVGKLSRRVLVAANDQATPVPAPSTTPPTEARTPTTQSEPSTGAETDSRGDDGKGDEERHERGDEDDD